MRGAESATGLALRVALSPCPSVSPASEPRACSRHADSPCPECSDARAPVQAPNPRHAAGGDRSRRRRVVGDQTALTVFRRMQPSLVRGALPASFGKSGREALGGAGRLPSVAGHAVSSSRNTGPGRFGIRRTGCRRRRFCSNRRRNRSSSWFRDISWCRSLRVKQCEAPNPNGDDENRMARSPRNIQHCTAEAYVP